MTVIPADRGPQVSGVAGMFLALSTVSILLRCYCRIFVVKSFGLDDWFAIIAWLLFVFFCAFAITGVHHGTGQHVAAIPFAEIPIGLKWWWACEPVYVLSNMALKFSIGIFLLHIALKKVHRIIIWTVTAVVEIYGAFFFFLFVLQCRPSAYFWTRFTGGEGTCIDPTITVNATYAYSAISCAGDWTLAILPVFIIWNIQMNARLKLVVALILGMAAIASTATIIRIPYVKDLANQADFLYATTDVAIWSTVETGIGISASAVATLRPLFKTSLSRKRLVGDSTTLAGSAPWSNLHKDSRGYNRNRSNGDIDAFELTSNNRKNLDVKTVVNSDVDVECQGSRSDEYITLGGERGERMELGGGMYKWHTSETKLTEVNRDDKSL